MRRAHVALATLVACALLLAWALRAFLLRGPALEWDEGVHLENALVGLRALSQGSLKDFLLWLDAPSYYPFGHALLVALCWLLLGFGETAARLPALLATLAIAPGTALLALRALPIEPGARGLAAVLAVFYTLSGPELMRVSGMVMLDAQGTALTVWGTLGWIAWLERPGWGRAALSVATVWAAFFTKPNYGLILGLALLLHGMLARAGFTRLFQAAVLSAPVALLWLYQEPAKKMALLSEYLWNRIHAKPRLEQWSFPVRSLLQDHAAWAVLGALALAGFVLAFRRFGVRGKAGILLVFPALLVLLQAASPSQMARYVLPGVPLLAVAAAGAWVPLAAGRRGGRLALGVVVPALGFALLRLPGPALGGMLAYRERAVLAELGDFAVARLEQPPLLLIGGFAQFAPSLGPFAGVRLSLARTGRLDLDAPPLLRPAPPAYRYTRRCLEPVTAREAREALRATLDEEAARGGRRPDLLVLELPADSPFRDLDYDCYNAWQEVVAGVVAAEAGAPLAERVWPGKLTARIYQWKR